MIIQEQGDQLIVIRQTDHAVLAGYFAREWGNELFKKPEPFESFRLATAEHDNGWREWEMAPRLDPKTRMPYSFMSIPTEEHIALYQRGIERVVKADHYAGLLVSMHCVGLYDRARATMPGFSAKYVKSEEMELVNDCIQRMKLQQLRLKVDLRAKPSTKNFSDDKILEVNARRLEALDRLSLYFCLAPPADATIDGVPADGRGSDADLVLRIQGSNVISITPYPFRKDPLEMSILARKVPKRSYATELDFQKTLAQAPYFAISFKLRSGDAVAGNPRIAVA